MHKKKTTKSRTHAINKKTDMPIWALAFIGIFNVWQMGMIYYSSEALNVNGDIPIPDAAQNTIWPIILGYIFGALLTFLFPRRVKLWAQILTCTSFVLLLLMNLPLSDNAYAILYYVCIFTCVTFIAAAATLTINIYSIKTAMKDGITATAVSAPFIAFLHINSFVDFRILSGIAAIIQIIIFIGISQLPSNPEIIFLPRRKKRTGGKPAPPSLLLIGTLFVFAIACFCILFSSSMVESIYNGITIFYIAGAVWALVFAYLYNYKKIKPTTILSLFLCITSLGFVLWLIPVNNLDYISIILQGTNICIANLAWFIAGILFMKWNSRFVAPTTMLIALIAVFIHAAITETLRSNPELLYTIYAGIALALLVIYSLIEPYFKHIWITAIGSKESIEEDRQTSTTMSLDTFLPLTEREKDVAELAVQGYINADIAKNLFISEHTVKDHLKSIYKKLDVHNRFELVNKVNRREN